MADQVKELGWKLLGTLVESLPEIARVVSRGIDMLTASPDEDDRSLGQYARERLPLKGKSEAKLESMGLK